MRYTQFAGRNFRWAVGIVLVVLCPLPIGAPSGAVNETATAITFVHRERSLQPGEVILLEARSSRPLKSLRARVFDLEFPLFGDPGGSAWTGLIGIDLETKPGRYEIELMGIEVDGKSAAARKTVIVSVKKFPTRELTVDEKFVTPPQDALIQIEEEKKRVDAIYAVITGEKLWHGSFRMPVPGAVISAFGKRNIYNGKPRSPHAGVDFKGAVGTPIRSPNGGRVVLAANLYYSGNTIIVDHGFGLYSYFGHMSEFSVKEGDKVRAGDLIGKVGATGRVTGPHLHWTVRLLKTRIDPISLVTILGASDKNMPRPEGLE